MSEVRVRIDELFREAGIAFAFPQRDVHVDLVAPVRVEWAGPAAERRS
jgi:small-conductance mechanosensitive channel